MKKLLMLATFLILTILGIQNCLCQPPTPTNGGGWDNTINQGVDQNGWDNTVNPPVSQPAANCDRLLLDLEEGDSSDTQ